MKNLLNFLLRYSAWFVFAFYVSISCKLLFQSNPFQHHVYLTSANAVVGGLYNITGTTTEYIGLRGVNEDLLRRLADIDAENVQLRIQNRELQNLLFQDSLARNNETSPYHFIISTVINNSISRPNNYITINKGLKDGISPEMGVIDQNGIVGVVNIVGDHYSRVISLLNPDFRLSCKLKGSGAFGSLVWDGKSYKYAILEEFPKQVKVSKGDTIITSGYSAVFPEGLPVGIVSGLISGKDSNFNTLKIKLLTDFSSLSSVQVISNPDIDEIHNIEQ